MDSQAAMMIVGGAGGYKVLELVITYFFRKVTRDDYVTKEDCEGCQKSDDGTIAKLSAEISAIKGILLVIAVKAQIPPEQLAKLTQ